MAIQYNQTTQLLSCAMFHMCVFLDNLEPKLVRLHKPFSQWKTLGAS